MPKLRVNGIVDESIVDGPGLRFVVFTQGCPHRCKGCHNPETHDPSGGYLVAPEELFERFRSNPLLSGITFSGGEPFQQASVLARLAKHVHAIGKTVTVFTGYTLEKLHELAAKKQDVDALLNEVDLLIDGPYLEELRDLELDFRGSSNQRVLDKAGISSLRGSI